MEAIDIYMLKHSTFHVQFVHVVCTISLIEGSNSDYLLYQPRCILIESAKCI